jgi:hypothetical protein
MQANPREYQRQVIDAEIKSLEESIRALRYRRNALAPVSSLPIEVIAAIFSFLRLPAIGTSPLGGKPDHHLAWIRVAHVCHQWREIVLNQPLFWSHVDFTNLTLAGAAEILARAKKAPLHLEAKTAGSHWDDARFSAFEKELLPRVSHIRHLSISTEAVFLRRTLEGLTSPAPILECLSLSLPVPSFRVFVPDTLFNGTSPRLSCLELRHCDISWKSPLLKGLRFLELRTPSEDARPSLTDWLDALDEMPQLKRLVLHSASPISPPFCSFDVGRTVTLPLLTHLDISAFAGDCALALAHLVLPALTCLCLTVLSEYPYGADVIKLLPYVTRHAHGPQDTQPLQSMLIHNERMHTDILAWSMPDVVVDAHDAPALRAATLTARVALLVTWIRPEHYIGVFDAVAALPLDSLVTLTVQHRTRLDETFWLFHASRWPLLRRVRLAAPAARGFREMVLLPDDDGPEWLLFPSLTKLDLIDDTALGARKTLRLCDALMKRVEQGVPLETLDLRACRATSHAVRLLSEIVVDVRAPKVRDLVNSRPFIPDDNSGADGYSDDGGGEEEEDYTEED